MCLYKDKHFQTFLRSFDQTMVRRSPKGTKLYHSISSIRNRSHCTAIMLTEGAMGDTKTIYPHTEVPGLPRHLNDRLNSLHWTGGRGCRVR